ncbi:DRAP deaminase [Mucor velutinosus]|uniref:DRAP deaminase n=1 Tax=Mucor velutinosus TaxID=708070 RepID=A0AAN7D7L6_9FUNG|nr:DRAP deaminase [Mucor velutinosus]
MKSGRQQQQQQPHSASNSRDVEQVGRNYRSALSELTFNSKPIITNLTIMAQENQGAASVIVKEIENQLRNNAAGQKLPVLYLIDSICKNVGGVYITNFSRNMVNVFLDAYALTDPTVRKSFERLLQTWKNGMPGGHPVFPRHIIEPIERSIMYIREKTPSSRHPHAPPKHTGSPVNRPSPSNAAAAAGIHVNPNFINKESHRVSRDPRNRSPQITEKHPAPMSSSSLLDQLQSLLPKSNTVNSTANLLTTNNDPVTQIISQIKAILPTLPPAQAASIEQYLAQIAIASPSQKPANLPVVSTPSPTLVNPRVPFSTTHTPTPPLVANVLSPAIPPLPASPLTNQQTKVDTADLLKSLTSMGYLSPSSVVANKPSDDPQVLSMNRFGPFILDSKDLQIARPGAVELLYSAEPLQCKQCGFRYPKTEKGQAKMDAHLDSHFRQNRKMKERVKRGLSRSWFVTVDEWINGEGGELMSQQAPAFLHDGMGHVNQKSVEKSNQASGEDAIDPNLYTVIMPDDDSRKPCAICGERFIDFWNDDEEEWMYKNAILVDGKIYHATCHADAVKSGTLVEADTDMPDGDQGLKRKAQEESSEPSKLPRFE